MSTGRSKLTRLQERAVAALLSERTHAAAAQSIGISLSTLQRWLRDADFQAAYDAARKQLLESALGQLQAACADAVETLKANLKAAKAGDQIRSAIAVIDLTLKGVDLLETRRQLEEMQEIVEEIQEERKRQETAHLEGFGS